MNSSQVRSKARAAMARREAEVEEEEIMSGEINLIPYLDIVTNLMLFLLASVSSGLILGQIDTTLPSHSSASSKPATNPDVSPDDKPLQMAVSITQNQLILWSASGLEGTLAKPRFRAGLMPTSTSAKPVYDLNGLNKALIEVATRRWGGKLRPMKTYEILLQPDGDIPYDIVIDVMDHLRRPIDPSVKIQALVGMPTFEKKDKEDSPTEKYDPEKHMLFADVLFAKSSFE